MGYGPWGLKESDTIERLSTVLNCFLNLAMQEPPNWGGWGGGKDTLFLYSSLITNFFNNVEN